MKTGFEMRGKLRIIAKSGDRTYLLSDGSVDPETGLELAQILDQDRGVLWNPYFLGSIMAHTHGYWEDYNGPQDIVEALVSSVKKEPN